MMRYFIVICVIFLSVTCYVNSNPTGVGAYAYQDSTGNRYGGTFDLNDADFRDHGGFPDGVPGFFPEFFKNLQSLLPEVFNDVNHQNLAFNAARKAFDITSNHALFPPNFPFSDDGPDFRGFGRLPGFNMNNMFGYGNMPGYSAFASGVASPDYAHQVASINPQNPNIPNVNVMNRFGETAPNDGQPHYIGVSSTSYSSSSNLNGKEYNQRGAQTVVNKDGKITSYKVQN